MFRKYVHERLNIFEALTSKLAKTKMAEEIVQHFKLNVGGRFLQEKGSGWVEVSDKVARTKVANCFRTMRCARKKDEGTNILP
jgi:hypothetical protein